MNQTEEKLMNSPTPEKVSQETTSAKPALDSAVVAERETNVDQIRSSIARLTSNSVDDLEKLTSELEQFLEFLKSEIGRVQQEIGSALSGIGIIIETIAPWKTSGVNSASDTRSNGREKLKRWP
jgi:septal ring factor EnvC (AmiA/AmiB activator)